MPVSILIGLGAGLTSALLFAAAFSGTGVPVRFLLLLSTLPVAIAGLGWGWIAAAVAATAGSGLMALLGAGLILLFYTLALGLPTAVMTYLVMLNRPIDSAGHSAGQGIEWYPIGHLVAWMALWAGCLAATMLLTIASDVEGLKATLGTLIERYVAAGGAVPGLPGTNIEENELRLFVELFVANLTSVVATLWMLVAMSNFWSAARVVRISGRLQRPWPDLSEIELPRRMPITFAGAVAATFLPGLTGLIASGFAGAMLFAYMLVGLAIIHRLTRGMTGRPLVLGAVYAALLFPWAGLLLALAGIAEPYSPLRRRPPPNLPPSGQIPGR